MDLVYLGGLVGLKMVFWGFSGVSGSSTLNAKPLTGKSESGFFQHRILSQKMPCVQVFRSLENVQIMIPLDP